jgi:hypothetical protein
MGQKTDCLGLRGTTRSRQDESQEVHEVGSKRPSSGCNGGACLLWVPRRTRCYLFISSCVLTTRWNVASVEQQFGIEDQENLTMNIWAPGFSSDCLIRKLPAL